MLPTFVVLGSLIVACLRWLASAGRWNRRSFVLLTVVLAGGAGFVYEWYHIDHQVVRRTIIRAAAWTTFTVAAVGVAVAVTRLRRNADTHQLLLDLVLAGVPMTWLAAAGGFVFLNQALDTSAPRRVVIPVTSAYATGERDTDYYLEVPGWPDARGQRKAELTRREFELVRRRPCVNVLWRAGRLGDGWVQAYDPPARTDCNQGVER